jgi:hypothetical protein
MSECKPPFQVGQRLGLNTPVTDLVFTARSIMKAGR